MATQLIRWGVLGPGRIAEKFASGIKGVDGAVLLAVASRSPDRAAQFAEKYGVGRVYDSYEALVGDDEIDLIYIATPHRFHSQQALLCLEAGKHVLCEKPLTVTKAQAERLFAMAKQNDLFIMEAMWTYFLPVYQQVRMWLDSGEIGKLTLMSSSFGIKVARDETDRWLNPELAGGALLDIGVYNLAISMWVAQNDVVDFDVRGVIGSTGIDELVAGTLEFPDGLISQFSCNLFSKTNNEFIIYGTRGKIRVHAPFWGATKASLITQTEEKIVTREFETGGFEYQIDDACRCLRAGLLESPVMPHHRTLAVLHLMDAMRAELGVVYPFE